MENKQLLPINYGKFGTAKKVLNAADCGDYMTRYVNNEVAVAAFCDEIDGNYSFNGFPINRSEMRRNEKACTGD